MMIFKNRTESRRRGCRRESPRGSKPPDNSGRYARVLGMIVEILILSLDSRLCFAKVCVLLNLFCLLVGSQKYSEHDFELVAQPRQVV